MRIFNDSLGVIFLCIINEKKVIIIREKRRRKKGFRMVLLGGGRLREQSPCACAIGRQGHVWWCQFAL